MGIEWLLALGDITWYTRIKTTKKKSLVKAIDEGVHISMIELCNEGGLLHSLRAHATMIFVPE